MVNLALTSSSEDTQSPQSVLQHMTIKLNVIVLGSLFKTNSCANAKSD